MCRFKFQVLISDYWGNTGEKVVFERFTVGRSLTAVNVVQVSGRVESVNVAAVLSLVTWVSVSF